MNQNYSDIVEQVSQILLQAIQERKSFLCENVKQVEVSLAKLLRLVGQQVMSMLFNSLAEQVTQEEKQKGLVIHRHSRRLPIGSGEVESAHRYIPQKRLKIAGATWHPNTINPMLALRVIRANHWWADFWKQIVPETKIYENTAFA